ncbi:MAG: proton-conducting transporter membrane subunit [Pseudomonadota bacterium]|nr:proton-conducting transporter membrane subunit [Pseudomonadota bacterium]
MNQLPILILVLPLLIVPICLFIRDKGQVYILTLSVSLINLLLVCFLFLEVHANNTIFYELGGWKAPIGIRLQADLLSCYFLLLINLMSFICILSGRKIIEKEIHPQNIYLFYIAWLLCNIGFSGLILTNDIFNLFVFLEISSLSSYFLISQGMHKGSNIAALQYLFVGSIGAVFILLGIGIIYSHLGTLNMTDISEKFLLIEIPKSLIFSIGLLIIGIAIKSAIFPLHTWLVRTYTYSPSIIVTYFAGTSTKVGIYILIRVFLDILNVINPLEQYSLIELILFISVIGVLLTTTYAIKQLDLKKMLAFSSIAQLSYIVIALMIFTNESVTASLVHIFNHSIIKTGLFLIIATIFVSSKQINTEDLAGLGKQYPYMMAAFVILSFGLIGIPLTSGFISKWYLVTAILDSNFWYLSIIVLVTSFMTLFYIWKLIEKIYFLETDKSGSQSIMTHQGLGILILTTLTLYLGIDTTFTVGISESISNLILSGGLK